MIVGICGGSGSGKTTLLKRLHSHFEELSPSIFSLDNYYYPIEKQFQDKNGIYNFDLPTALNEEQIGNDLRRLKNRESLELKEYHFNYPPDKHSLISIEPSDLIIVEGLFLFHYPEVKELVDFSVFISVDPKIQLDRRLYRDQETRGYTREEILYQWENHVTPCYSNYLLPYKDEADFQFINDSKTEENFNRLTKEISFMMEKAKAY